MPNQSAERMVLARDRTAKRNATLDQPVEGMARVLIGVEVGQVLRGDESVLFEHQPAGCLDRLRRAEQLKAAGFGFTDSNQTLTLQHDLNLVPVRLVHAAKDEERLVRAFVQIPLE